MTPLMHARLLQKRLTQGIERAVLQALRQTLAVERVRLRAGQPAGAGRVHRVTEVRGHAGAAGWVVSTRRAFYVV